MCSVIHKGVGQLYVYCMYRPVYLLNRFSHQSVWYCRLLGLFSLHQPSCPSCSGTATLQLYSSYQGESAAEHNNRINAEMGNILSLFITRP